MTSTDVNPHQTSLPAGTATIDDSLETIERLYEYNHWIYSLLRPHVRGEVLEVGAGTGNITRFLAMQATRVVGVEPVEAFVERFERNFAHMSHVHCARQYLSELAPPEEDGACFDTVVSCNVLEHIEDDVAAVRQMTTQLRQGGRVVLFVPAGRIAFGRLDRELGHFRRYTLRSVRNVMEDAGLRWVTGRYSNAVGLLGWFVNSVVLRKCGVPAKQALAFNRIAPLLAAIERCLPLPFGQSVLGVGERMHAPSFGVNRERMRRAA